MLANHRKAARSLTSFLLGGALLLALGGCLREDENALVVFGPDSVVVLAPLGAPDILRPPTGVGQANALELVSFDPGALDAFGRTTVRNSSSQWPYWNRWFGGGEWSIGRTLGVEGWLTADQDPRSPALSLTDADVAFDYLFLFLPGNAFGIGMNWFGEFCCATPGELYVIGLERTALTVNGELDHSQVLLGQAVDQPDALAPLDGSPAGDHTFPANKFITTPPVPSADANPLLLGTLQACPASPPYLPYDATCAAQGFPDGELVIDFVIDPGGVLVDGSAPTASNSPVAPNQLTRFSLPSYNYLVIWETNPDGTPDFSSPLTRVQLGVDLSDLGGPVNNAFAPFPTAGLSDAELALGTGAVSRPDSATFTLENLEELAGSAAYQVWALTDAGPQALDFNYTNNLPDGTVVGPNPATSFAGGPGDHIVQVAYPDNATHVVVTIESSAGASSPSNAQILWAIGLQESGVPKGLTLPMSFGTFGEARTWAVSGAATGGLFGDEFRELYSALPRPPVGYKYVAWLVAGDSVFTRLPDETFTSPPPEYTVLESADTDPGISPVVQPGQILEAFTRICLVGNRSGCDGPYDLGQFDTFVLTLEPRAGDPAEPSPTRVLQGLVPTPSER